MEVASKLARLVNWVRQNTDRHGAFQKSALYTFARRNDLERSALMFVFRCRQNGTMQDRDDGRIEVLVPKGRSLEQFYKDLLRIQDKPILTLKPVPKPEPRKEKELKRLIEREIKGKPIPKPKPVPKPEPGRGEALRKEKEPEREKEHEKPMPREEAPSRELNLVNAVAARLEDRFKRIEATVAAISSLVEERIKNLEKNVSLVIVEEQEKRIKHLEKQIEQFRAKAEAFDLIKRDAWEVVQALDIVEAEREDVKKVLKRFL